MMHPGPEVLLLSVLPGACASALKMLRGQGMTVRVAANPGRALALLRRRPSLVLVDLVHGPGLDPSVVRELNREPRDARVVALHDGRLESHLDQTGPLVVDGYWRLEGSARTLVPAD